MPGFDARSKAALFSWTWTGTQMKMGTGPAKKAQRAFQLIVDDGKKPSDFMMVICLLKQEGLLSN